MEQMLPKVWVAWFESFLYNHFVPFHGPFEESTSSRKKESLAPFTVFVRYRRIRKVRFPGLGWFIYIFPVLEVTDAVHGFFFRKEVKPQRVKISQNINELCGAVSHTILARVVQKPIYSSLPLISSLLFSSLHCFLRSSSSSHQYWRILAAHTTLQSAYFVIYIYLSRIHKKEFLNYIYIYNLYTSLHPSISSQKSIMTGSQGRKVRENTRSIDMNIQEVC